MMAGIFSGAKDAIGTFLVEKAMEGTFKFLTDFFGPLTKTKWGTKALLAMSSVGCIGYLTYIDKITDPWATVLGIVVIFVTYCVFRQKQEKGGTQ